MRMDHPPALRQIEGLAPFSRPTAPRRAATHSRLPSPVSRPVPFLRLLTGLILTLLSVPPAAAQSVTKDGFGRTRAGEAVDRYTLRNAHGIEVQVITYGAIVTTLRTPDRKGRLDDVVLGFERIGDYEAKSPYFGAVVGRVANRVARGRFTLDGKTYTLAVNNGPNALHGGLKGFDKVVWSAESFRNDTSAGVVLKYTSKDGEEGYPGALAVQVTYTLTQHDALAVDYRATTTKATPVNLSQHTYWNLAGTGATRPSNAPLANGGGHILTIHASAYTPVDSTLIPTGELAPVAGTPFDFRTPTAIGKRIGDKHRQLRYGGGYDHNFALDRDVQDGTRTAIRLEEPTTGRTLDIATTEPGVQFYSGNFLDGTLTGKAGRRYAYRGTVVLET